MNELVGIKTDVEEPKIQKKENPVVQEPIKQEPKIQTPIVQEPQSSVIQEPIKQTPIVQEPIPVPVPVPQINPVFSLSKNQKEDILRIEKIEINPEQPTEEYNDETTGGFIEEQKEYVIFRIYSPYYDIYKTLFTNDYLKSIGFDLETEGVYGGGEQEPTFPYNLFKALFNNTFGRFSSFFQPKKESLAEETVKQGENVLVSISNFKTDELLKPKEEKTNELYDENNDYGEKNNPPYFELKIPKKGSVLSKKDYNEQKIRETNDEILEHDENGKTFQEILLETQQDEIQKSRKQTLLSVLNGSFPNGSQEKQNIVDKIKELEMKDSKNEKIWFIKQEVINNDNNEEWNNDDEKKYKLIKLNLHLI